MPPFYHFHYLNQVGLRAELNLPDDQSFFPAPCFPVSFFILRIAAALPQIAADIKAVFIRQHHIQKNQVKALFTRERKTFYAVLRRLDFLALTDQQISEA